MLAGLVLWLVFELVTAVPDSFPSAVAITVLTLLATVWVASTAVGLLRRSGWARGSAMTWQIMQIAVAVGCFQGVFAVPALGWTILAPSLVGIALLLSPAVAATTRRSGQ